MGLTNTLAGLALDDAHVVVSRDPGGNENPGLYWMDVAGGALTAIFAAAEVQARLAFITDDSRWVYYLANDRDPASLVVVTSDRGLAERVRALGATVEGASALLDRFDRAATVPGTRLLQPDPHPIAGNATGDEDDVAVGPADPLTAKCQIVDGQDKSIPTLRPGHGSDTINARQTGVNLAARFACSRRPGAQVSWRSP